MPIMKLFIRRMSTVLPALLILPALFFLSTSSTSAQEPEALLFPRLGDLADVSDIAKPSPFKKIPELHAQGGVLDVDLYIERRWVKIGTASAFCAATVIGPGARFPKRSVHGGPLCDWVKNTSSSAL